MEHPDLIGRTVKYGKEDKVVTSVYRDSEGKVTELVLGPLDYLTNLNRVSLLGKSLTEFLKTL